MSTRPAILVSGVSKSYRLYDSPAARLYQGGIKRIANVLPRYSRFRSSIESKASRSSREFHALSAINVEIAAGESVAIIGKNGSGKSTLLQIIAGTLAPTTGSVSVNGRVAALLELGSGFNPEFTGRENVYTNGAVLGLTKREIDSCMDDILGFADIGAFIDEPVKTYSSGMMMRLAFSVQTAVKPDILIVDEALAVGDAGFVSKCINRVSDFLREGGTLLFVSHDVGLAKQLTQKALYLKEGKQVYFGDTNSAALAYDNDLVSEVKAVSDPNKASHAHAPFEFQDPQLVSNCGIIAEGQALVFRVPVTRKNPGSANFFFSIYNFMGIIVVSGSREVGSGITTSGFLEIELPRIRLAPGSYRINYALRTGIEIVAWHRNALYFSVAGNTGETFIYREDFRIREENL